MYFAPFFDSCQSRRPKGESGKKSTFFYFDENGEKLKKNREISPFDFFDGWKQRWMRRWTMDARAVPSARHNTQPYHSYLYEILLATIIQLFNY